MAWKIIEAEQLTVKEVVRQLIDGLDMDLDDIARRLENYLKDNPMTLEELNNECWEDSTGIFNIIM